MSNPSTSPPLFSSPSRRRTLALAEELVNVPLTTVVAPGGSGKTTLLSAWRAALAANTRQVWLDASTIHGDVGTFVDDLLHGLQAALRGAPFGRETTRILSNLTGGEDDWRILHRAFLRDWLGVEGETVVFLDNFHNVPAGSPADRWVSEMLRSQPANLHWVVSSRGTLPGAAVRLAAGGLVHEVGFDDLNLRFEEAKALLESRGIEADDALVTTLLGRTEGWVTGLQLAARVLQRVDPDERRAYAERIGRERDLFHYIAAELLAGESEEQIQLLERAAVLGRASPETLGQLLDPPGGLDRIEHAIDHGLLLGDGNEVWPHQLWQEFLRERLKARLSPQEHRALHGRAARLLAEQGRVEAALEAYRESEDWQSIAFLLHEVGHEWLDRGRARGVQRWLEALPGEVRESEPRLLEMQGLLLLEADPKSATRYLEQAARAFSESGDLKSEGGALGALTYLGITRLDLAAARRSLLRGFKPSRLISDSGKRAEAFVGLAGFAALRGRFGRSLKLSERALRAPLPPLTRWFNLLNLGLLYSLAGDFDRGRTLLDEGLGDRAVSRRAFVYNSLLIVRALLLSRSGDHAAARRDIEEARRGIEDFRFRSFQPPWAMVAADAHALRGDRDESERAYADFLAAIAKADAVPLEAVARGQRAVRCLGWGDADGARAEAERCAQLHERGIPEGKIAFPWWIAVSLWVLGRTGDAKSAWARLAPFRRDLRPSGLPLLEAMIGLTTAELAHRAGEDAEAASLARDAWKRAERDGVQLDPMISPLVLPWATAEAFRQGVAEDFAFDALRRLCPAAVPGVLATLAKDRNTSVRMRAVECMAEFGGRALHGPLERATRDRNAKVRAAAERALPALDLRPDFAVRIRCLGRLVVERDGEALPDSAFRGNMGQRLLGRLLASEGRPLSRDVLQTDLWPEADEAAGKNNLRVSLSRLSDALDPERLPGSPAWFLQTGGVGVALDLDRLASWDVGEFREAARRAEAARREGNMEEALSAYAVAVDRYEGPFLPEAAYEEWSQPVRRRLEDEFRGVAERYGEMLLDGARREEALKLADRLLDDDPADENAWLLRMRVQLMQGDRVAASRTYDQAREAVRAALDVEPGEALRDLAARVRGVAPE